MSEPENSPLYAKFAGWMEYVYGDDWRETVDNWREMWEVWSNNVEKGNDGGASSE